MLRSRGLNPQTGGDHCCPLSLSPVGVSTEYGRKSLVLVGFQFMISGTWRLAEKMVSDNFLSSVSQYLLFQNAGNFHSQRIWVVKVSDGIEESDFSISLLLTFWPSSVQTSLFSAARSVHYPCGQHPLKQPLCADVSNFLWLEVKCLVYGFHSGSSQFFTLTDSTSILLYSVCT